MLQLFLTLLLITSSKPETPDRIRSCRRLERRSTWWDFVWSTFSEKRFKSTFRISRTVFTFMLDKIQHELEKDIVTEQPVSPAFRLGICLYRFARGDCYWTLSELSGLGIATIQGIVIEVSETIVRNLWQDSVSIPFPTSEEQFKEKIIDMEERWQFPYCWSAIDGCPISIKCLAGGAEDAKEYHNFKNFYSIVLRVLVDAKYRFIWASVGFPSNSHDSMILRSTQLWRNVNNRDHPSIKKH